eukprot:25535-Alexandrium_andersonii.AAC.1
MVACIPPECGPGKRPFAFSQRSVRSLPPLYLGHRFRNPRCSGYNGCGGASPIRPVSTATAGHELR